MPTTCRLGLSSRQAHHSITHSPQLLRGRQEGNHYLAAPELSESRFEAGDILWNVEPTYLAPEYAKDVLDAERHLGDMCGEDVVGDDSPDGHCAFLERPHAVL